MKCSKAIKVSDCWGRSGNRTSAGHSCAGNIFNIHLPQHLSPEEACLTSTYLKREAEVCEELVVLKTKVDGVPCCPVPHKCTLLLVKSLEKELNSPNNTSKLKSILRVLALWRDLSFPARKKKKKVLFFYYCLFFRNWKLSFPAWEFWELQPSRYFFCPKHNYWQNCTQMPIQPLWVKIKTVSRTFISAIKAIKWFLGHVLTQQRNGFCCMAHTLTLPLHGTDV